MNNKPLNADAKNELEASAIYVVTAYRWGYYNAPNYVVCATNDADSACEMAEAEQRNSGRKYGVEVGKYCGYRENQNWERLAYFPSARGEDAPCLSWMNMAAINVGLTLVRLASGRRSIDGEGEIPEWLRSKIDAEIKLSKVAVGIDADDTTSGQ